jgi:hypothetical protein
MVAFATRIGGVALAAGLGLSAALAQAGYVVDLTEQGGNVVATGSGAIDVTDLSFVGGLTTDPFISPTLGSIVTGADENLGVYIYAGITGPSSFGSGNTIGADAGAGGLVGVYGHSSNWLFAPQGYQSDTPLSETSTYFGATFSSLGVTPGVYTWTWGEGADADSFTLAVGTPEPSTWAMMLLGFAGLGFAGYRRTRKAVLIEV